jgi:hypothetical protein
VATTGTVRIIVVADVGSTLLNRLGKIGENDPGGRNFSARQIIHRFVQLHSRKIDGVVALSPRKEMGSSERNGWLGASILTPGKKRVWRLRKSLRPCHFHASLDIRLGRYSVRAVFRRRQWDGIWG